MPKPQKPLPTFEVALLGELSPEQLPIRTVSDALSAVQDLAAARDSFVSPCVPDEQAIGLLDVRRGSATFQCVARDPNFALANLRAVGKILESDGSGIDEEHDRLSVILRPIEELSRIAKTLACRVAVRVAGAVRSEFFSVVDQTYGQIAARLLVRGDTTIVGCVERAGGATKMRCLLRVPGRRRLLYCDVRDRELVRRLGQHLYEDVAASGTATWIHRTWRVHAFEIHDFSQPHLGPVDDMIDSLRRAGLDAWDNIADPQRFLERCGS